jgi:hypothetical protein
VVRCSLAIFSLAQAMRLPLPSVVAARYWLTVTFIELPPG